MFRKRMSKRSSKKLFTRKARVKAKNNWSPMRGGFRI